MDIEPHFITAGAGFAGLILGFALRPLALAYGARWPFALCVPVMAALGVTAGLVTPAPLTGMALALAVFILFASGVIDYQTKRIPNLLVLALIVVAALSSGFGLIMPWDAGLIGAALGVGLLLLVDFIYRLRGRGRGVGPPCLSGGFWAESCLSCGRAANGKQFPRAWSPGRRCIGGSKRGLTRACFTPSGSGC